MEALGEVAGGKDPAVEKRASRAAARAEREAEHDAIERVAPLFIEKHAKGTRDWKETERLLKREVVDPWKGRRLSSIKRPDVYALLDGIIDRGAPSTARHAFAALRVLCGFAVARGLIEKNPCEGVTPPPAAAARDRVLSDEEVRLAWRAFERVGWPFGPFAKLLLLTGARRSEVAGMRRGELDLAERTWTIPAARSKNRRENIIPLSDAAIRVIEGLPIIDGSDFIFSTTGSTAISGFSHVKGAIDRAILEDIRDEAEARGDDLAEVKPPEPWTLHDLRRTVATNLQKLGVRLEVTEACLNHVSGSRGGIVGVYQKYGFEPEKRMALDAWSRKLADIVRGDSAASNVVALKTPA